MIMNIKLLFSLLIVACIGLLPSFVYASDNSTSSAIYLDGPLKVTLEPSSDDLILKSVETSNAKISASDTNGLKALMLSLIGDYETTVTDYTYQSGTSGYYTHSINVERDWAWIMSCALFIVVIYCVFRAVGGILCN